MNEQIQTHITSCRGCARGGVIMRMSVNSERLKELEVKGTDRHGNIIYKEPILGDKEKGRQENHLFSHKKGTDLYFVDRQGRVTLVVAKVNLDNIKRKRPPLDSKEVKALIKGKDHKGHLNGHQNGGPTTGLNLVAMDGHVNTSNYKKLENLANRLCKKYEKDGRSVYFVSQPIYDEDNPRPIAFLVTLELEGKEGMKDEIIVRKKIFNKKSVDNEEVIIPQKMLFD